MNLGEGGRRGLLALTSIASFMVALDLLVVATALTTIQSDLAASTEAVQWIVTAYGLTFAGLLMTGAGLGDRFGRRCVFTIGLAVFAAASVTLQPGRPASLADPRRVHSNSSRDVACRPATHQARRSG
jgi:MFS family permease